tara:strand:- start:1088 stop:1297 length:210 start_codon:yes stop_codon:yes gene_type:complete
MTIKGIETDPYIRTSEMLIRIPSRIIPSRRINFKEKLIPFEKVSPIFIKLLTVMPINIASNTVDIGLLS